MPETSSGSGFDRRSALKKAAVAGTIAWAAPTILSDTALAQAPPCTPKCAPFLGPSFAVQTEVYCVGGDDGRKAFFIRNITSGTNFDCPCGPASAVPVVQVGTDWTRRNACDGNSLGGTILVSVCTDPNGSGETGICVEAPSGSLQQGIYTGTTTITLDCEDRSGNVYRQVCSYFTCVSYSPGGSSCFGVVGLGNLTLNGCAPVCNPA